MTRPDRSLPRRQAPPLSREANDRTNGRLVSMSRTTLGGRGILNQKAANDPGSRSGRYRAGRDQQSAFWRVFRRRSTVHLWAARPDG